MTTALWQVDPVDAVAARRLTRSAAGEAGGAAFLPDGSLLFTSSRPDPDAKPDPATATRRSPVTPCGSCRRTAARRASWPRRRAASTASPCRAGRPSSRSGAASTSAPPRSPRTPSGRRPAGRPASRRSSSKTTTRSGTGITGWRRAAGISSRPSFRRGPRRASRSRATWSPAASTFAFEETGADLTPDGRTVVASRNDASAIPSLAEDLVAYDVATGEARVLTPGDAWYDAPACSPDGRSVAALRVTRGDAGDGPAGPARADRPRDGRSSERSPRTSTAGRTRRSGRPTAGRSSSPRTTTATSPSTASRSAARSMAGSPASPRRARTPTCARPRTGPGSTRCARRSPPRRGSSGWTRAPSTRPRQSSSTRSTRAGSWHPASWSG